VDGVSVEDRSHLMNLHAIRDDHPYRLGQQAGEEAETSAHERFPEFRGRHP
jgi:hypothetical protein